MHDPTFNSCPFCFLFYLLWLKEASGPRVKLASCKSALNPPVVYSSDRSKAVVPVLVLVFVALWFILRGDLLYVCLCVILFLCFSVLLVLRLPRLGKRELILVLFVRLFDLCLFGFVGFLFLLGSGKGCRECHNTNSTKISSLFPKRGLSLSFNLQINQIKYI